MANHITLPYKKSFTSLSFLGSFRHGDNIWLFEKDQSEDQVNQLPAISSKLNLRSLKISKDFGRTDEKHVFQWMLLDLARQKISESTPTYFAVLCGKPGAISHGNLDIQKITSYEKLGSTFSDSLALLVSGIFLCSKIDYLNVFIHDKNSTDKFENYLTKSNLKKNVHISKVFTPPRMLHFLKRDGYEDMEKKKFTIEKSTWLKQDNLAPVLESLKSSSNSFDKYINKIEAKPNRKRRGILARLFFPKA